MTARPLPSLARGAVIAGRYEVIAHVGSGGMGDVYEVEHRLLGRRFALKRLAPDLTADRAMVERFLREARAAAATHHAGVVEVSDLGFADDGWPFLVMERLRGETLRERLRRGPLSEAMAVHVGAAVADALAAAHGQGVIHRDIKPENLFLCEGNPAAPVVKVLDFGLALLTSGDRTDLRLTQSGAVMGTPLYMSPEQARGQDVDARTDLYSLGAVLYEAVACRPPFAAEAYSVLVAMILEDPAPPAPATDGLRAVIARALAKARAERYASAAEMRAALLAAPVAPTIAIAGAPHNAPRIVTAAATIVARLDPGLGETSPSSPASPAYTTPEARPPVASPSDGVPAFSETLPSAPVPIAGQALAPLDARASATVAGRPSRPGAASSAAIATAAIASAHAAIAELAPPSSPAIVTPVVAAPTPAAPTPAMAASGPLSGTRTARRAPLVIGLVAAGAAALAIGYVATRPRGEAPAVTPAAVAPVASAPVAPAKVDAAPWEAPLLAGNLAGALDAVERAALRRPGDPEVLARALLIELAVERRRAFARVSAAPVPADAPALLAAAHRAVSLVKDGDAAGGAAALGQVTIAATPGSADALLLRYARAILLRQGDRFDLARAEYAAILAARPGFAPAVEHAIESLILFGDVPGARAILDGYVAAAPDSPDLELRTAEVEMAERKYRAALDRLERLAAADPRRDAEVDELRGDLDLLLGHVDDAIAAYQTVDDPGRRAEYIAGALLHGGRVAEARAMLRDAIRGYPADGKASRLGKLVLDAALLALVERDAELADLAAGALTARKELEAPVASARAFAIAVVARLHDQPCDAAGFPLGDASPAFALVDSWDRVDAARAPALRRITDPANLHQGVVTSHVYPPLWFLRAQAEAAAGDVDAALAALDQVLRPAHYDPTRGTIIVRALGLRAELLTRAGRAGEAAAVKSELAKLTGGRYRRRRACTSRSTSASCCPSHAQSTAALAVSRPTSNASIVARMSSITPTAGYAARSTGPTATPPDSRSASGSAQCARRAAIAGPTAASRSAASSSPRPNAPTGASVSIARSNASATATISASGVIAGAAARMPARIAESGAPSRAAARTANGSPAATGNAAP
ncbi:MAG: protein kinase [Deltaproteobacteria bacterium]|nr:protein kinase [Deltaproteobacteria bacterium]